MEHPFTVRDPYLIESRRLHLHLDNERVSARANLARKVFERLDSDNPEWADRRDELQAAERELFDNRDTIGLLHWTLGRDIVADAPKDILLPGELVTGVYAGPVACFQVRNDIKRPGKHISFMDYDELRITSKGWLAGKGTHEQPAKALTFRDALLPVPFKKFEVLERTRSALSLKILA